MNSKWKTILTVLAVIFTVLTIIAFASPSTMIVIIEHLPDTLQQDFSYNQFSGRDPATVVGIIAGILWLVRWLLN